MVLTSIAERRDSRKLTLLLKRSLLQGGTSEGRNDDDDDVDKRLLTVVLEFVGGIDEREENDARDSTKRDSDV